MKAIHNPEEIDVVSGLVVFANAKILNWKQFTTYSEGSLADYRCFCKCKDTKLKAIHNTFVVMILVVCVVFANAKILNWKQFTTSTGVIGKFMGLFLQMQRY